MKLPKGAFMLTGNMHGHRVALCAGAALTKKSKGVVVVGLYRQIDTRLVADSWEIETATEITRQEARRLLRRLLKVTDLAEKWEHGARIVRRGRGGSR